MKIAIATLVLPFVLLVAQSAHAGDPLTGKKKSEACAACHGWDGNSASPTFPRLAGQNEDYLIVALKSYKDGRRKNEIMKGMAANLSVADMEDLAAYFASQPGLEVKR